MKLFKTLREEALEKVKNAKVFADKKSADTEKDDAFSKKGQEAKCDDGKLAYGADKNKVQVTEAATVKTGKYSWGTMKTVHHGADFSIPLHPEHQEAIGKLKDEQEHKFKDETGHHWVARRKGDDIHFDTTGNGSMKTRVPLKHITEAAPVAPAPYIHRIGVTVSDPDSQVVSKRNETIQKFVQVHHHTDNKEEAIARGKKHFAKKGWKVHDAWHAGNVNESVTEDVDQAYSDWQNAVKKKNPEHANKIKFKSNADQRHVISAEHGDRSFGTFNMKTGESDHLGEQAIRFVNGADPYGHTFGVGAVRHDLSNIKTKKQELPRDRPIADIDPDWEKEQAEKRKGHLFGESWEATGKTGTHRESGESSAEYKEVIRTKNGGFKETGRVKWKTKSGKLIDDHFSGKLGEGTEYLGELNKSTIVSYIRNEEAELDEARSLEDKIKVAKDIYAEKLKSATSPADRAQAKEDHENLIKKLSESESLDEVSKTTLVSYIKKAARSAADSSNEAGFKAGQKQPKYNVSDETPTEIKRHKGIALAARKLSK